MRICTWNINGIRAAIRKGLGERLEALDADVLLFQEVRATPEQLPSDWAQPETWSTPWHAHWHPAQKLGYAGTALWSRNAAKQISRGLGSHDPEPDAEGRVITAKVGPVRAASIYLPSGSSGEHRQQAKDRWLEVFLPWAEAAARSRVPTILGGDLNIAHTERDIFHWKSNQKTSGFLPHERAWFTELLGLGWHDLVREQFGDIDGPYSWWSNRGQARALDRGWRIDYLLANKAAKKLVQRCGIDREAGLAISDHAPVWVDLDIGSEAKLGSRSK